MRIENGQFCIEKGSELLSSIRYIPYYSEKQKQWYIIDFGFHTLWLGWLGVLAPLFYRFLTLKAYLVDEENIDSIQNNVFFSRISLIMTLLSIYPILIMSKNVSKYGFHSNFDLSFNKFFEQHVQLTIIIFILSVSLFFFIIIKCTPNISKNKNYEYLRIKVKINNIKMFMKIFLSSLILLLASCWSYFFGGLFIIESITFTTIYFSLYSSSFNKSNNIYTGQLIFDDKKHNSIYL